LANPAMDAETHRKVHDLVERKWSHRRIAKHLGISLGTVSELRNRAVIDKPRADKKHGEFDWREWVPAMQQMQALKKKSSYSQDQAVIELGDGKSPVALASFSDQHMGAWSTNYDSLKEMTDELMQTPNLYIALLGDYGHYAIKLRNVLEVADNLLTPEQQTDFLESWFEEIWPKVALATWENHGVERQEKQAGESSTKRLLSRKVVYFNGIGHADIKVGNQIYKGAFSHCFRGRSIENACHSQMRYMRREGIDRDFAMSGDTHLPGMTKYVDGAKVRVAINSGSLQANSGYAKRYFSLVTHPCYPIVVLHPDKHMMIPFWSIKEWLASKEQ
jgi:hypothetical protein